MIGQIPDDELSARGELERRARVAHSVTVGVTLVGVAHGRAVVLVIAEAVVVGVAARPGLRGRAGRLARVLRRIGVRVRVSADGVHARSGRPGVGDAAVSARIRRALRGRRDRAADSETDTDPRSPVLPNPSWTVALTVWLVPRGFVAVAGVSVSDAGGPSMVNLVTNALKFSMVVWKAPGVVGKSVENVTPVT